MLTQLRIHPDRAGSIRQLSVGPLQRPILSKTPL